MRGIEAATWGSAIRDGEVRQSKAGNDFGTVNIAVNEGKTDDSGKELSTYVKVLLFGQLAQEAAKICKGDRVYTEGTLSASIYQHESGPRIDLTIKAFKFERTGIGKNRQFREKGIEPAASAFRNIAAHQLSEAPFKTAPHSRERPKVVGRDDFGDGIPF